MSSPSDEIREQADICPSGPAQEMLLEWADRVGALENAISEIKRAIEAYHEDCQGES